mgnify:CR=1 FL=1
MRNKMMRYAIKAKLFKDKFISTMRDNSGQGAVDVAIVCLLSVILGALILAGLYALMKDTILPTLTTKIQEMFNYTN